MQWCVNNGECELGCISVGIGWRVIHAASVVANLLGASSSSCMPVSGRCDCGWIVSWMGKCVHIGGDVWLWMGLGSSLYGTRGVREWDVGHTRGRGICQIMTGGV